MVVGVGVYNKMIEVNQFIIFLMLFHFNSDGTPHDIPITKIQNMKTKKTPNFG